MTGKGVSEEGAPEERQARVPPQCAGKGLAAGSSRVPCGWSSHVALAWHWPGQKCVPQQLPCSLPLSDGCHRPQHPLGCPAPSCPSLPATLLSSLAGTERRPGRHRRPMAGLVLASSQRGGPQAQLGRAVGLAMPRKSPKVGTVGVEEHTQMCA